MWFILNGKKTPNAWPISCSKYKNECPYFDLWPGNLTLTIELRIWVKWMYLRIMILISLNKFGLYQKSSIREIGWICDICRKKSWNCPNTSLVLQLIQNMKQIRQTSPFIHNIYCNFVNPPSTKVITSSY